MDIGNTQEAARVIGAVVLFVVVLIAAVGVRARLR